MNGHKCEGCGHVTPGTVLYAQRLCDYCGAVFVPGWLQYRDTNGLPIDLCSVECIGRALSEHALPALVAMNERRTPAWVEPPVRIVAEGAGR